MRSLLLYKKINKLYFPDIYKVKETLKLQADWRKIWPSTVPNRLAKMSLKPAAGEALDALGVSDFIKPNELPTYRLASIEDFISLHVYKVIFKYINERKLLVKPDVVYKDQGGLSLAFNALSDDVLIKGVGKINRAFIIVRNLFATAYNNPSDATIGETRDRRHDALELLKPIKYWNFAIYAPYGKPYNDPATVNEEACASAVATIAELIDENYFTSVGADMLYLERHKTTHGCSVYVGVNMPERISYGNFVSWSAVVYNTDVVKGIKAVSVLNNLSGFDMGAYELIMNLTRDLRETDLNERRLTAIIGAYHMSTPHKEYMPAVWLEPCYQLLFILCILDLIQWSYDDNTQGHPINEVTLFENIKTDMNMLLGTAYARTYQQAHSALFDKFIMFDSKGSDDRAVLNDYDYTNGKNVYDFFIHAEKLMIARRNQGEIPAMRITRDTDVDINIIKYLVMPERITDYYMSVPANTADSKFIPNLVGVIDAACTWAAINTERSRKSEAKFPRSSVLIEGKTKYEDRGFVELSSYNDRQCNSVEIDGVVVFCPISKVEEQVLYARDYHLYALMRKTLELNDRLYDDDRNEVAKEEIRWEFMSRLYNYGSKVQESFGSPETSNGSDTEIQLHSHYTKLGYALTALAFFTGYDDKNAFISSYKILKDISTDDVSRFYRLNRR